MSGAIFVGGYLIAILFICGCFYAISPRRKKSSFNLRLKDPNQKRKP